ncbi:MAG: HAD-IC family P-type ATPase [Dehalococcoidales bacterium]|jgi:Ca2+-transporting ATPase
MENWHNLSIDESLRQLAVQSTGLTEDEVGKRRLEYGANELETKKNISRLLIFLNQFKSPLIYVLAVAAIVSFVIGHSTDAFVILGILILNAAIGFFQETQAEKSMNALLELASPKAKVRRDNKLAIKPARELVPGDIIHLEAGDKVPADARLIEAANLKANESALTGESMPVEKNTRTIAGEAVIADQLNMTFLGTAITGGRATALVVKTGMSTEMGQIARGLQEVKPEPTPLQKNVGQLSRYLMILFLGATALLLVAGLIKGMNWTEIFLVTIAAAVSAIPEGLPAVLTVVLSIGMRAMAKRNAIVRKLLAVETLGSATVICSDKTGTLTMNQMTVRQLFDGNSFIQVTGEGYNPKGQFMKDNQPLSVEEKEKVNLLLKIGALCNDARLMSHNGQPGIIGDPTDGALVVAAEKAGIAKEALEKEYPRIDEIPFESEKQYHVTLHNHNGKAIACMKGAAEKVLQFSKFRQEGDKTVPIQPDDLQGITAAANRMAQEALRVIALAYLDLPPGTGELPDDFLQRGLIFAGLVGMEDPPREEAKTAVKHCKEAGIKVVMITGDNKVTAESIARQLELPPGKAVTGAELSRMTDEELHEEVENISVFARIEPLHKLRIVNAFKSRGHVVAMTGDGVNDAPALKAADIGIAMGITGTDVAKEASNMVLADDNFASVVAAVDEGRAIFNRLRNVIFYMLSTNIGELMVLILSVLFLGQSPLMAVQILWVNLATDTAGDIPLGFEPKVGDELKKPPRRPGTGLIYPGLLLRTLFIAVLIGIGSFLLFRWAEPRMRLEAAETMTFCALNTFVWFIAFSARSDEHSVFKIGFFKNKILVLSIAFVALLQVAIVYTPFLQTAFHTAPIRLMDWGIIIGAGLALFLLEETRKHFFPRLFSWGKW